MTHKIDKRKPKFIYSHRKEWHFVTNIRIRLVYTGVDLSFVQCSPHGTQKTKPKASKIFQLCCCAVQCNCKQKSGYFSVYFDQLYIFKSLCDWRETSSNTVIIDRLSSKLLVLTGREGEETNLTLNTVDSRTKLDEGGALSAPGLPVHLQQKVRICARSTGTHTLSQNQVCSKSSG